jgi:NAD-dependent dihydropyrimidine dehydrogenase PreA subunit
MIQIDSRLCDGCGSCVDTCPVGAISLKDQRAAVAEDLCTECGVCVGVCPQGAILLVDIVEQSAPTSRLAVPVAAPVQVVPAVAVSSAAVAHRTSVFWPLVGSALAWAGRELAPRLADLALTVWERRAAHRPLTVTRRSGARLGGGGGRHHRQRRRNKGMR